MEIDLDKKKMYGKELSLIGQIRTFPKDFTKTSKMISSTLQKEGIL